MAASASVEVLEEDSGPGRFWDPQHCLWPVVKQTFIYTHLSLAIQRRESCIVKSTSLALRKKEENGLYSKQSGTVVVGGETLILYWFIFASF